MTVPVRRLTRHHFALYRGWLEGAAIEGLHAAYGEPGTDVRVTRRLVATLRDTLATAARRARDVEAAHLLRLKPGSIPPAELHGRDDVPTLEAYRAQVDPDGFYSEAELLELYRADFPPQASAPNRQRLDRKIARNARLRTRQAAALARIERALAEDPAPDHPVDGWFAPAIAARLQAAGLATLADLLTLIQRRRQRWYTAVPRLGPKGAQRITDWLDLHARAALHPLPACDHAAQAVRGGPSGAHPAGRQRRRCATGVAARAARTGWIAGPEPGARARPPGGTRHRPGRRQRVDRDPRRAQPAHRPRLPARSRALAAVGDHRAAQTTVVAQYARLP
jgi:hypothetical protein